MEIILDNIGKKFNRDWIFRGIHAEFRSGTATAILGTNGSGKSTLLQVISGKLSPTEGSLNYLNNGQKIEIESLYRHISMASPYLELIEEYTLDEHYQFHAGLKPLLSGVTVKLFLEILGFQRVQGKAIRYFSSGMKQRVKLALAFLSDSDLLLLDEPCANLDAQGMEWYAGLYEKYAGNRLVLVCSNHQSEEISFCSSTLNVNDYK